MMTTGYDCPDILNLCLMRPIFSPTDFIQIKGRGTRKHNFTEEVIDTQLKIKIGQKQKEHYKMFDFFANCEYFESKFNYDEVLKLPQKGTSGEETGGGEPPPHKPEGYTSTRGNFPQQAVMYTLLVMSNIVSYNDFLKNYLNCLLWTNLKS